MNAHFGAFTRDQNPFASRGTRPYSADARNLKAVVDVYACCMTRHRKEEPRDVEKELIDALATEPANGDALLNLESFYRLVQRRGELRWRGLSDTELQNRIAILRGLVWLSNIRSPIEARGANSQYATATIASFGTTAQRSCLKSRR